jgi:hypothetical protein
MGRSPFIGFLVVLIMFSASSFSQAVPAAKQGEGFTAYAQFGGTVNSLGQVYAVNSSIGYTFTPHLGVDVGVPIYFVNGSASTAGATVSDRGIGNPWVDVRWKFLNPTLSYGSVLTGSAPLGDSKLGLSTGRATFDWANRFEHSFSAVTPFLEAGLSNTTTDSQLFLRPYTTLGMNGHFRGGVDVKVWKRVSVGGSGYDILPFGDQTVFSRVSSSPNLSGPGASHGRNFQNNQQTTGTATIADDNGFSSWVDISPNPYVDAELGYTRSIHYDLNSISFSLGFNVGRMIRRGEHHQ